MAAILRETEIACERVLALDGHVLVASKSEPGVWHVVADGACSCPGYQYRHTCRHLAVAVAAGRGKGPADTGLAGVSFTPAASMADAHHLAKPICPGCGESRLHVDMVTGRCAVCLVSLDEE